MDDALPIRFRCGRVQGRVEAPRSGTRAVCYCIDCQAFAHFLGSPRQVLDPFGGTEVLAVQPRRVRFDSGWDSIAGVSLTGRTCRWYSSCCRTAIGNTPRDPRMAHVGLVHECFGLSEPERQSALGPVRMRVNRHGASGEPPRTPALPLAAALARYAAELAWARVSGTYRQNPFFDAATGQPRVAPQRLSKDEYAALKDAVREGGRRAR